MRLARGRRPPVSSTRVRVFRFHVPFIHDEDLRELQLVSDELFVAGGKEGKQSGASAFSPDGKWLVYRNMPNQSLYMQPFPATGTEIRLTQKTASQPMWSHDGRELFYRFSRRKDPLAMSSPDYRDGDGRVAGDG